MNSTNWQPMVAYDSTRLTVPRICFVSSTRSAVLSFFNVCFADSGNAGCEEVIRILPLDRIRIFHRHLAVFRIERVHSATYGIPGTNSNDFIPAGTTDYQHPAIIDMFTK